MLRMACGYRASMHLQQMELHRMEGLVKVELSEHCGLCQAAGEFYILRCRLLPGQRSGPEILCDAYLFWVGLGTTVRQGNKGVVPVADLMMPRAE